MRKNSTTRSVLNWLESLDFTITLADFVLRPFWVSESAKRGKFELHTSTQDRVSDYGRFRCDSLSDLSAQGHAWPGTSTIFKHMYVWVYIECQGIWLNLPFSGERGNRGEHSDHQRNRIGDRQVYRNRGLLAGSRIGADENSVYAAVRNQRLDGSHR